jgi:hypothetical protein
MVNQRFSVDGEEDGLSRIPSLCWLASRKLPGNSASNVVKCLAATPSRGAGEVYPMNAVNTRLHHAG